MQRQKESLLTGNMCVGENTLENGWICSNDPILVTQCSHQTS